jgi:hypothetical protein
MHVLTTEERKAELTRGEHQAPDLVEEEHILSTIQFSTLRLRTGRQRLEKRRN